MIFMQRSWELVALRYTHSCWMKILMLSTRSSLNGGDLRAALDRESGLYKSYSWQQFVNCNLITYMNPTLKSLTVFVYPAITSSPSSLDQIVLPRCPTRRRHRHQLAPYPISLSHPNPHAISLCPSSHNRTGDNTALAIIPAPTRQFHHRLRNRTFRYRRRGRGGGRGRHFKGCRSPAVRMVFAMLLGGCVEAAADLF